VTGKAALNVIKALVARQKACAVQWTTVSAHALDMSGSTWRVTLKVASSKAGKGTAIWLVAKGSTKPSNTLAKKISAGCG